MSKPPPQSLFDVLNKGVVNITEQHKITDALGIPLIELDKSTRHRPLNYYNDNAKGDDLFHCMRYFLMFGRVIGIIPLGGVFSGTLENVSYRRLSISGLISLVVILILSGNTVLAILGFIRNGGHDAFQIAKHGAPSICYGMGLFVFLFMYFNSQKFLNLLHKWRQIPSLGYSYTDKSLFLTVNVLAGIVLTSAISENAVSHVKSFTQSDDTGNKTLLEWYYEDSHSDWAKIIPYNPAIAIIVFICNKWAVYAWNFGDLFIAIISRALYGQFREFLRTGKMRLSENKNSGKEWEQAVFHHMKLCRIAEEFAELLSPLVFTLLGVNIYFICLQLNLYLAPAIHLEALDAIYLGWSFIHLSLRIMMVVLTASEINIQAHEFTRVLRDCPPHLYSLEVQRAEEALAMNPVGLDGLKLFFVTRSLQLSIIGVVVTFEIVLLQATAHLVAKPTAKEKEEIFGDDLTQIW